MFIRVKSCFSMETRFFSLKTRKQGFQPCFGFHLKNQVFLKNLIFSGKNTVFFWKPAFSNEKHGFHQKNVFSKKAKTGVFRIIGHLACYTCVHPKMKCTNTYSHTNTFIRRHTRAHAILSDLRRPLPYQNTFAYVESPDSRSLKMLLDFHCSSLRPDVVDHLMDCNAWMTWWPRSDGLQHDIWPYYRLSITASP